MHLLEPKVFLPGDPPPSGYLDWHAWAKVQQRAGLRQRQCQSCRKWYFQQELYGFSPNTCLTCHGHRMAATAPSEIENVPDQVPGKLSE